MVFQTSVSSVSRSASYCRYNYLNGKGGKLKLALMAGVLLALNACSTLHKNNEGTPGSQIDSSNGVQRIALILPLSGRMSAIGMRMRDAARLALPEDQMPQMDIFDSAQPGGIEKAASDAIAAGDRVIIGPLKSDETSKVADIAQKSHVPELAFTSDSQQARPGVWIMGITPEQQVRRLVDASAAEGRKKFAAFLPDTALGHAMGEGLAAACQDNFLEPPKIIFHTNNTKDISLKMAELSAISDRMPPEKDPSDSSVSKDDQPSAVNPAPDSDKEEASESKEEQVQSPPFDALLLGDTGLNLAQVISELKKDKIDSANSVRILGPMLWRSFDVKLGDLKGAWYVAFDAKQRSGYVNLYQAKYHQKPSPVTDFAYDAVALAAILTRQNTLNTESLTRPDGFMGVNGVFYLREDGNVIRDLSIYQIAPEGGGQLSIPASRRFRSVNSH